MTTIGAILVMAGVSGLMSATLASIVEHMAPGLIGHWYKPFAAGSLILLSVGFGMMMAGKA
jgi:hypothetical protein